MESSTQAAPVWGAETTEIKTTCDRRNGRETEPGGQKNHGTMEGIFVGRGTGNDKTKPTEEIEPVAVGVADAAHEGAPARQLAEHLIVCSTERTSKPSDTIRNTATEKIMRRTRNCRANRQAKRHDMHDDSQCERLTRTAVGVTVGVMRGPPTPRPPARRDETSVIQSELRAHPSFRRVWRPPSDTVRKRAWLHATPKAELPMSRTACCRALGMGRWFQRLSGTHLLPLQALQLGEQRTVLARP